MSISNDPLWVKVAMAINSAPNAREGAAAVLRVIADEVVPEESQPEVPDFPDSNDMAPWQCWRERQRIRRRLLAEAERAEAGR